MICDLREKEQTTVIPITDESQELQLLYVQTRQMHRMFEGYPEVLVLDATYRTNKHRMPLFVFMAEDGAGSSHVVAYAFVASGQQHVVSKLLETFVQRRQTPMLSSLTKTSLRLQQYGIHLTQSLLCSCANFM